MENNIVSNKGVSFSPRQQRSIHLGLPSYTLGEELVNAITHGLGVALSIAAMVILLVVSAPKNDPLWTIALAIYGASLILLYLGSTLYHALGPNRAKKVFRIIDHCTIYLLIAGSYTPYTLLAVGGGWGLGIFIAVWACAILGIVLNAISVERFKLFSMASYVGMGWCIVLVFSKLTASLPRSATYLLLLGGILYTLGIVLYAFGKKIKYMHSIWHLFVLGGSITHFFSLYIYLVS